jgi:hypothetical protein
MFIYIKYMNCMLYYYQRNVIYVDKLTIILVKRQVLYTFKNIYLDITELNAHVIHSSRYYGRAT